MLLLGRPRKAEPECAADATASITTRRQELLLCVAALVVLEVGPCPLCPDACLNERCWREFASPPRLEARACVLRRRYPGSVGYLCSASICAGWCFHG